MIKFKMAASIKFEFFKVRIFFFKWKFFFDATSSFQKMNSKLFFSRFEIFSISMNSPMHGHAWSMRGHAWDVTFYMDHAWDRMGPQYGFFHFGAC